MYGISGANQRADQWRIGMLLIRTWGLDAQGAPDSISYLPASLMNRCLLIKLTMPLSFSAADATGGPSVSEYWSHLLWIIPVLALIKTCQQMFFSKSLQRRSVTVTFGHDYNLLIVTLMEIWDILMTLARFLSVIKQNTFSYFHAN